RTKAQARGHTLLVANGVANRLQRFFVLFVHLHVREQRGVIAFTQRVEVRAKIRGERLLFAGCDGELSCMLLVGKELDALIFENRRLWRQRSRLLVLLRQGASLDLA